ncbi:MAG TPA: hypothetical protein VGI43_07350 [Mucilaginibacter sp.]|jgi:hypothetical protein
MKLSLLILLPLIVFGCNSNSDLKRTEGYLNYIPVTESSEFLSANLNLSANVKSQELSAEIRLTNHCTKSITIEEVTVFTRGGLRSFPNNGNIKQIGLHPGGDTLIIVKFNPVNDIKVHQLTGKQGHIKLEYNVSVFFKVQGDEKMSSVDLNAKLTENDYKTYISTNCTPFIGYSFNTETNFAQNEGEYLETLNPGDQPFAFVTHQELAVTGLNIWMKSLCEHDSLYAELLIVSQANYEIKIVPDSIDFTNKGDNALSGKSKIVALEKIVGSPENKAVMQKGDKVLIHLKKCFKSPGKKAILSLKEAFLLRESKPLFNDNIGLVKVSVP